MSHLLTSEIRNFSSVFSIIFKAVPLLDGLLKSARLFLLLLDEKRSDLLSDTKALKEGLLNADSRPTLLLTLSPLLLLLFLLSI